MKRAFARLPDALAKTGPNMSAIMPERLALTEANVPVKEVVGSGPFRFVAAEHEPGARVVYERHASYVPRAAGEIGFSSGPKLAKLERVEWTIVPDPATAVAALQRGEVDWIEAPIPDLMPVLARDPGVTIKIADQVGIIPILRFNCLRPPFDDARLRRVVLEAVDQREVLAAYASDETILRPGVGVFPFGTPMENRSGMEGLFGPTDLAKAKQALKDAGYAGEKVLLMAGADNPVTSAAGQVVADLLGRIGFNVDFPALDFGDHHPAPVPAANPWTRAAEPLHRRLCGVRHEPGRILPDPRQRQGRLVRLADEPRARAAARRLDRRARPGGTKADRPGDPAPGVAGRPLCAARPDRPENGVSPQRHGRARRLRQVLQCGEGLTALGESAPRCGATLRPRSFGCGPSAETAGPRDERQAVWAETLVLSISCDRWRYTRNRS